MAVKTYRFTVNTDAGETGLSRQININGILVGLRTFYNAAADAGTNFVFRGNYSGDIFTIHSELANNTNGYPAISSSGGQPVLLAGVYEVFVDSAGGALTPAVDVIAEVLE